MRDINAARRQASDPQHALSPGPPGRIRALAAEGHTLPVDTEALAAALRASRERTLELLCGHAPATIREQPCNYLSPPIWDVGHLAQFEELWCLRRLGEARVATPTQLDGDEVDRLFDPFHQPRKLRGRLPLPDGDQAFEYLDRVRGKVLERLERCGLDATDPLQRDGFVYRMILGHEAQHQETLLQALEVAGATWQLAGERRDVLARNVDDRARVRVEAGPCQIGADAHAPYDNEQPAFEMHLDAFELDRFPVSNRRWLEFLEAGGYSRRELWSAEGWDWRQREDIEKPLHWSRGEDGLALRRNGRVEPLDPREPVEHIGYFEAQAFARFEGGRVPTEFEWEKAARFDSQSGAMRKFPWGQADLAPDRVNFGQRRAGPAPIGSLPRSAADCGAEQMIGCVYEWTSSPFDGYRNFRAFPYREYSQAFFGTKYRVLRGGSWAATSELCTSTYRNWDLPIRRQLFCGLRLAWD